MVVYFSLTLEKAKLNLQLLQGEVINLFVLDGRTAEVVVMLSLQMVVEYSFFTSAYSRNVEFMYSFTQNIEEKSG